MSLPVVFGALAFIAVATITWCLCRAAARGDAQQDELEPRRRARDARNGIGRVDRAS